MKKKLLVALLCGSLLFCGCGASDSTAATAPDKATETAADSEIVETVVEPDTSTEIKDSIAEYSKDSFSEYTTEAQDAASIESDSHLLTVEVTLPASVDDATDADLEELRKDPGYVSIVRNSDNSITYVMTKDKQKELLNKLETRWSDFAANTPGSSDYPNVTKLEVNNDFSKFTITVKATNKDEIGVPEIALASVFYSFGGAYRGYSCDADTSVTVEYVCDSTGEVIATGNSGNVQ